MSRPGTLCLNGITIDPVARTISYDGNTVEFDIRKTRNLLFDTACRLIIGPPATYHELCEAIYGDDEDGGPEYALKSVEAYVQHLKPRLERLRLKIFKGRAGRDRCHKETWIAPDDGIRILTNGVDHDHGNSRPVHAAPLQSRSSAAS